MIDFFYHISAYISGMFPVHLLNGIVYGLVLTILVGPILFALVQTGIEKGIRAGITMGTGIWISDIIFILVTYKSIAYLSAISDWSWFELSLGIVGGMILILIGALTFFSEPPEFNLKKSRSPSDYIKLFIKGFLINTVNPFTVFFWISVMSTMVVKDALNTTQATLFLGGIIGTIIVTDVLKIALAKYVRRWLTSNSILWMRRISGIVLFIFGITLAVRVIINNV